ncbi:hypothetical protein [Burkholderia pseudomallei]|uniref:Uncharacterized protein n=1 Tax=Burkholderia pseudomallei 1710a TaxID=320371 RepID=A0A0E1VXA8_BURPE|nr:hypothetical protein [Burkholderia pseudomallei]EET05575.1 conserved hypothetical protein [Burkholderia pseudomallei 1710a]
MQQFVWRPDAGAAARVNRFRYFLLYVVRVIGKKSFRRAAANVGFFFSFMPFSTS